MPIKSSSPNNQELIAVWIAGIAVLFGLFVRANGLGTWPLSVDEYYITKSTLSILDNGIPELGCKTLYMRGLLQQYISAVLAMGIGNTELAMRLYPTLSSLVALWAVFLLGRRVGGLMVGCIALALTSLSLWEIEMSRFARMYMPFQALALMQIYLLIKIIFDRSFENYKWMLLISALGIVTSEGAIFLTVPLIIALFRVHELRRPSFIILTGCLIILNVGYMIISIRMMTHVPPQLPEEVLTVLATSPHATDLPELTYLLELIRHPVWLTALIVLSSLLYIYSTRHTTDLTLTGRLCWLLTLACLSLSLVGLGIAIYISMALVLLQRDDRINATRFLYRVVVPALVIAVTFWSLYLYVNLDMSPRDIAETLINYPKILGLILFPFIEVVPVLIFVLAAPIATYAVTLVLNRDHYDDKFVLLIGMSLVFIIGVALVTPHPFRTRYIFFLYPVVICLFGLSIVRLAELIRLPKQVANFIPALTIVVFSITEDFDIHHYLNINTPEINYRTRYSTKLQEHFKSRNDNRTPALYVNENMRDNDTVIISESAPAYYLNRVQYRYEGIEKRNFANFIVCGLEHELWSGARVLYKRQQIDELIRNAHGDVWLIETINMNDEWQQKWKQYEVFMAADERSHVLRIPAGG